MGAKMNTPPGPDVRSPQHPESRVLILGTGGTICCKPTANGLMPMGGFLNQAMAPSLTFNDRTTIPTKLPAFYNGKQVLLDSLRTPPSAYSRHVRYAVLEFDPLLDSAAMSSAEWNLIALTIQANYKLYDGFVILHGTDTLAYTASALSFLISDLGKPVVVTGSQAPIFALLSDATDNLLGSLIIAGTFTIPEVCVYFNHKLLRGNRTTKVSSSAFDAFDSPNYPPLARASCLGIDVNWPLVRRTTRIAEFSVTPCLDPAAAHVACLCVFPGMRPDMIDAVLDLPGLRGVVLHTFGVGNMPPGVNASTCHAIGNAIKARGVVVVNVSQCLGGYTVPAYESGDALLRLGVVFARDMTMEAAMTKLTCLIAVSGLTSADIAARMAMPSRGEMTDAAKPSFEHPSGFVGKEKVTSAEAAFTALGWAIRDGNVQKMHELLHGDETSDRQLLRHADYAGNTALHLAAVSGYPSIVRELLMRGASVHVRNRANNTPLYLARKTGQSQSIAVLTEAGGHLWAESEGHSPPGSSGVETPKTPKPIVNGPGNDKYDRGEEAGTNSPG